MKRMKRMKSSQCRKMKHAWELLGFGIRGSVYRCEKCGNTELGRELQRDRRNEQ